jgi:uridine phosphorylase
MLKQVAVELGEERGVVVHSGINATDDAFYAESPEWIAKLSSMGLTNVEMESSAMFVVARLRGLRAGMVCAVSGNLVTGDVVYGSENHRLATGWTHSIDVALEAVHRLGL